MGSVRPSRSTRSRPAATCSAPATSRSATGACWWSAATSRPTRAPRTRTSSTRRRARGRAGADMSVARWYPTVTTLPDGRVFVVSGDNITLKEPGHERAAHERLQHAARRSTTRRPTPGPTCRRRPGACRSTRSCSCCRTASCSTRARTPRRARFDLSTSQWTMVGTEPDRRPERGHVPARARSSSPAPGPIPSSPAGAATNRAAAIDMTAASPAWQEVAPMKYRRSYHTLTVLPDGKVLATGGQTSTDGVDETTGVLAGRDVGSGHQHVDDDGLHPAAAPVPLVGDPAARRPRAAGRRRRLRQRQEREERRDLLAAVPVQGPAPDDHERAGHAPLRPAVHVDTPDAARIRVVRRSCAWARSRTTSTWTSAS